MPEKVISDTENEQNTAIFLKTNGPPEGAFKPDLPDFILRHMANPDAMTKEDRLEMERYKMEMISISTKQNQYLIEENKGHKGALRAIYKRLAEADQRFGKIDATLKVFTTIHDKWLTRKKVARNTILAIVTILVLPTISLLLVELLKPWLFKVLSIHP